MGNFCSSKQDSYQLYTQHHLHSSRPTAASADEYKSPLSPLSLLSPSAAAYPTGPCVIPSLFDLCVQQLCLSLLDSNSVSEIRGRRKQSIRMTEQQLFILRQLRDGMAGEAANAASQEESEWRERGRERDRERRQRTVSVSAKESPELSPQPTVGSPRWLPMSPLDARLAAAESLNMSVSHAVQGKYTASSRSLSAQQSLQRKDSLSSLLSSPSAVSHVDSGILRPMQSPDHLPYTGAVSMPVSPAFRFRNRSYDEAEAEEPILSEQGSQRSVSSYAGSAMTWAWERGRRRSWFAGAMPPPQAPSMSPNSHFSHPQADSKNNRGRLRLPESIVELIFHRLVSQRLLTLSCLELFAGGGLVRIDLGGYEGVTDQWLGVLLSGGSRRGHGALSTSAGVTVNRTDDRKMRDESSGDSDEDETTGEAEMEEGDEEQADEDDEERKEQADKSYAPLASSGAIDIEQPDKPSLSVRCVGDNSWSLTSSPVFGRQAPRALPSSLASTRSPSLSSSYQTPAPLSSSPAIKSLTFSSLPSPAAFSLSSPLRDVPFTLSVRSLDLSKCDAISDSPLYSLHNAPYLTHLNLDGCTQVSDEVLRSVLPSLHSLLSLNLNNCRSVSDTTLSVLASHVRLQHLLLDSTDITDHGLLTLSQLTRLRTLSVGWNGNRVTNAGLTWLASCFSLRRLCICYTAVTDVSLYRSLQRLRQLDVSGTKVVVPSGAIAVRLDELNMQRCKVKELPAVFLHHGLKRLDGGFCPQISSGKWAAQLGMLARSKGEDEKERERKDRVAREGAVKEVDGLLETSEVGDEEEEDEVELEDVNGCYEVDQALSYSPSISSMPATTPQSMPLLPLSGSSFTSAFSSLPSLSLSSAPPLLDTLILESANVDNHVASLLPSFPLLTHLNLSDTEVDQDGLQHLSPLTQLRMLNLSGNRLNNASLAYLSPLTSLTALQLDSIALTDAGLLHLQPLIALTSLDLFECSITDAGVAHLTCLTALQTLEICSTKLTNACLPHLLHLPSLTSLNLARNVAIDDRGVGILAGLTRLVHLNLSHSGVTHKGVGEGLAGLGSVKCVSLFGCRVNVSHERMRLLPVGVQVGVDQGIVAVAE